MLLGGRGGSDGETQWLIAPWNLVVAGDWSPMLQPARRPKGDRRLGLRELPEQSARLTNTMRKTEADHTSLDQQIEALV